MTAISSYSIAQLRNLTTTQIGVLSATDISSIETTQVAVLTTKQVTALTAAQIAALSPGQFSFSAAQLAVFGSPQIAAFSTGDLAVLNATQLAGLTATELAGFSTAQIASLADNLIAALTSPFEVSHSQVTVGASAGIAICPTHGESAEDLLVCADLALYEAKGEGRSCRRFFNPGLRQRALRKKAYEGELRCALARGEFELFYQPQVLLPQRSIVGAEALIRWRHPEHGLLPPSTFLPSIEMGVFATQVGDWILETACLQAATWRRLQAPGFRMGVNLFSSQLRTGDLAEKVARALQTSGLPPDALELEITETTILRYDEAVLKPLRLLRSHGVGIAFDDFGTGYASLSMLRNYPLSRLKIDQSFVRAICDARKDAAVVRLIVELGATFDLDVIAEGVETRGQAEFLESCGCRHAQGYLFGCPIPAADFSALLTRQQVRASGSRERDLKSRRA